MRATRKPKNIIISVRLHGLTDAPLAISAAWLRKANNIGALWSCSTNIAFHAKLMIPCYFFHCWAMISSLAKVMGLQSRPSKTDFFIIIIKNVVIGKEKMFIVTRGSPLSGRSQLRCRGDWRQCCRLCPCVPFPRRDTGPLSSSHWKLRCLIIIFDRLIILYTSTLMWKMRASKWFFNCTHWIPFRQSSYAKTETNRIVRMNYISAFMIYYMKYYNYWYRFIPEFWMTCDVIVT